MASAPVGAMFVVDGVPPAVGEAFALETVVAAGAAVAGGKVGWARLAVPTCGATTGAVVGVGGWGSR